MKKFVYAIGIFLLFVAGCDLNQIETDNIENPKIESIVAAPLGETQFSLEELIRLSGDSTSLLTVDSTTSLISLTYTDNFTYTSTIDIVTADNIPNSGSVNLPFTAAVPSTIRVPFSQTFNFSYPAAGDDADLDSIFYESGILTLSVTSSIPSAITYNASIPNTESPAGQSVTLSGSVQNETSTSTQDLAGYKTTLTEDAGGNKLFTMTFSGEVVLTAGDDIPANSQLSFTLEYQDQVFDIIYGDFGDKTLTLGNEPLEIDFFNTLYGDASIEFENPTLTMTFRNSIGIPMGLQLSGINGEKVDDTGVGTVQQSLNGTIANSPQVIGYPTVDEVGSTVESTIVANGNNSTLPELISFAPNRLNLNITALTNPNNIEGPHFFDPDFTTIEADVVFNLPFRMKISDLVYEEDFSLGTIEEFDEIDSAALKIVTSNLLPINVEMTFQILDASGVILYEEPELMAINSAFLDINFISRVPEPTETFIPLGQDGLDALVAGDRINLIFNISTPQALNSTQIFPPFLANYTLDVKLGILAKLNLDF